MGEKSLLDKEKQKQDSFSRQTITQPTLHFRSQKHQDTSRHRFSTGEESAE